MDPLPTYCEAAGAAPPEGIDGRSFWPVATGAGGYAPREACLEATGDFLRGAREPVFFPAEERAAQLDGPTDC